MKTRIHINLSVRDLTRSVAFYGTLLGHMPTKLRPDYANFRLDEPALHLALVHRPDAAPTRAGQHFGVELFEDAELDTWRERVAAAGLPVRIEEQVTCCYAIADKFWARDPDGNEWEFWVRHEEAEAMHASASDAAGCCAPTPTPQEAMPLTTLEGLEPTPTQSSTCTPDASGGGCC